MKTEKFKELVHEGNYEKALEIISKLDGGLITKQLEYGLKALKESKEVVEDEVNSSAVAEALIKESVELQEDGLKHNFIAIFIGLKIQVLAEELGNLKE